MSIKKIWNYILNKKWSWDDLTLAMKLKDI